MLVSNNKGVSLIGAMVAVGVLGAVSVGVMQLSKNSTDIQTNSFSSLEYKQMADEFHFLIQTEKDCVASLADPSSPVTFRGSTIPRIETVLPAAPTVPVQLWSSNAAGARSRKRFDHTDPIAKKYGQIDIDSVELIMPDHTTATDFPAGVSRFKGELVVQGSRRISANQRRAFPKLRQYISLTLNTNGAGVSRVIDCKSTGNSTTTMASFGAGVIPGEYDVCMISETYFKTRRGKRSELRCTIKNTGPRKWKLEKSWNEMRGADCKAMCYDFP